MHRVWRDGLWVGERVGGLQELYAGVTWKEHFMPWTYLGGSSGNASNRNGTRVSGQNCMRRTSLCKLREDLGLEIEDLWDSLNHHVNVSQVVHLGGRRQSVPDGSGIRLADLLLGYIFGEELVGEGKALVE